MTKRILRQLKIEEISVADRPANKFARIAICKRADAPPPPPESDAMQATDELRQLAMAEQQRSGCAIHQAYNAVLQTPRGRDLYARSGQGQGAREVGKTMSEIPVIAVLESTMDVLAEHHASANDISKSAAYDELLKSDDEFRHLYTGLADARRSPREIAKLVRANASRAGVVAKVATTDAEAKLDKMAADHAASHGIPFAKAYGAIIETAEGRALYGQHRREHGQLQGAA